MSEFDTYAGPGGALGPYFGFVGPRPGRGAPSVTHAEQILRLGLLRFAQLPGMDDRRLGAARRVLHGLDTSRPDVYKTAEERLKGRYERWELRLVHAEMTAEE